MRKPRPLRELEARANAEQPRLQAKLGREPTIDELARALGAPRDEVARALERAPASDLREDDAPAAPAQHGGESRLLLDGRARAAARARAAVLRMRYEEDFSQAEIARREGVSQATVSRLIRDALERLRESMQTGAPVAARAGGRTVSPWL